MHCSTLVKVALEFKFLSSTPCAPTEEIFDGTATWGTSGAGYLTPQKIGTGTQIASIVHRGFAYAVDDVAVLGCW